MQKQLNRKAIWISALLTFLALGFGSMIMFGPGRLFAASQGSQATTAALQQRLADQGAVSGTVVDSATDPNTAAVIAAYQEKLAQAYQALQDAYAQIQALQQAQGQGQSRSFNRQGREREPRSSPFFGSDGGGVGHD